MHQIHPKGLGKQKMFLLPLGCFFLTLGALLFVAGCSTEKKAFLNKAYHYTTTKFNGYFHGREALKLAQKNLYKNHVDDYDQILEVYRVGSKAQADGESGNLDRAILKMNLMIDRHSMKFKEQNKKVEYNPMIDDCYYLMGQAYFYKMQYDSALHIFKYMINAYPESKDFYQFQLAQIKSMIYAGEFVEAETKFKALEEENKTPKKLKGEFFTLRALYYLRTNDHQKAILALQKAINFTKKKKFQLRLKYILAQLYERGKKKAEARNLYAEIAKKSLVYDMAFSAKLHEAKLHEGGNDGQIVSTLNKMLKDDKNIDYKDQIYYTLGELSLKKGNKLEARKHFEQSVSTSTTNTKQKSLSYLALADGYFSEPNYVPAQRYYDSCMFALPETYPDYELIASKAVNLNELVAQLDIISREDSLQRIAKMSDEEQLAFVEQLIEKEEEAVAAAERAQAAKLAEIQAAAAAIQQQSGGWLFDNPTQLASANAEFVAIWGTRKLEDNWRRSDKSTVSFDVAGEEQNPDEIQVVTSESLKKTPESYLVNLPKTEEDFKKSDEQIRKALYQTAVIFKDRFGDMVKANEYFEALNNRFPSHPDKAKTSYQLYRSYDKLGETAKADQEKAKILSEFPNSEYALLIKYPNRGAEEEKQRRELNDYYELILKEFKQNRLDTVINYINQVKDKYAGNPMLAQFDLLGAFAIGKKEGKEQFENKLKDVTKNYQGSVQAKEAQEILDEIKEERMTFMMAQRKAEEQARAFDTIVQGEQYYVIIFSSELIDSTELLSKVQSFNATEFSENKLKVELQKWEGAERLLIVSSFKDESSLKIYSSKIRVKVLDVTNQVGELNFFITPANLDKLKQYKETEKYLKMYKMHYKL